MYKLFYLSHVTTSLLDSKLPEGEVRNFLLLFECFAGSLVLCEGTPQGTGLLGPQVQWLVLLAAVELSEVFTLRVADDGQHTGNGLPDQLSTNPQKEMQ